MCIALPTPYHTFGLFTALLSSTTFRDRWRVFWVWAGTDSLGQGHPIPATDENKRAWSLTPFPVLPVPVPFPVSPSPSRFIHASASLLSLSR